MYRSPKASCESAGPLAGAIALLLVLPVLSWAGPIDGIDGPDSDRRVAWSPQATATNFGLQFDGSNDLVDMDPGSIGAPASLTVEAWIRIDATEKTHILVTNASSDFNDGFTLLVNQTNRLSFTVATNVSTKASVAAENPLEPDTWYHVAGVFDAEAGLVQIFVNGVEEGSQEYDRAIQYSSGRDLLLGAQRKPLMRSERFLQGALDEIRIWDRARAPAELTDDMKHELAGDEPGLLGYWPLNEGAGLLTAEASSGTSMGELINGPVWIETPWREARELLVTIDVKPDELTNTIPVRSEGVVPVAILGSADFDAVGDVDRATLTFGRTGDEDSLHRRGLDQPNCGAEDVNLDGLPDLVCQFETRSTDLQAGDNRAILRGTAGSAGEFRGEDWINAVQGGPLMGSAGSDRAGRSIRVRGS